MKKEGSDLKIMEEMERKKLQDRYIRFDWAIKRLLRQKANFDVLDGFLTVMLNEEIRIVEILESEGNQRRRQVQSCRHQSLEQQRRNHPCRDTKHTRTALLGTHPVRRS